MGQWGLCGILLRGGNPLSYRTVTIKLLTPTAKKRQVLEEAQKLAAEFAQNARRALILWKQCLNENYEHELPKKFNNNLQATIAYQPYHDFKEASTAFIEKRVPEYDEQ